MIKKNCFKFITKEKNQENLDQYQKKLSKKFCQESQKSVSVGQEVLPEVSETSTIISEPSSISTFPLEEHLPEQVTEEDYERAVQLLKETYPEVRRRVYKTVNKTWEQVYEELVNIIKNIQTKPKRITNK
jgi:hemoglobin-like flavoprotein